MRSGTLLAQHADAYLHLFDDMYMYILLIYVQYVHINIYIYV